MSGESLYTIASEMLCQTNVFRQNVSEIKYTNSQGEEVSLLDCVKQETKKYDHRFRGKSDKNLLMAHGCIAAAMITYLESYPAPFSFKQQTRGNFVAWLDRIVRAYPLPDAAVPDELKISDSETDTGVAMLKLLHAREGVTYADLQKGLGGLTDRAVQKDLVKISPSLYKGTDSPYVPFRLGGQPLLADIKLVDERETSAEKKRFHTVNTVHPLVLQENIMQLATLLKALCHQYYDYEDDVSRIISVDIWSQMSEYARQKIINYFAFNDENFEDFIYLLSNTCPDDHACTYRTEKDLLQEIEMPVDQALPYLMKVRGRTGAIILSSGNRINIDRITSVVLRDGTKAYQITDDEGFVTEVKRDDIKDVLINK